VACAACGPSERAQLDRALIGRGRILLVGDARDAGDAGDAQWGSLQAEGSEFIPESSVSSIASALAGSDALALSAAMASANVQGLLADPARASSSRGLARSLASYARLDGLQGAFLSRGAALYVLDPVRVWSPELRAGLAKVSRRLVAGTTPPRMSSFPEATRRLDPVEVMVLLRQGDQPRLWRSARGSSFARALLTAAAVARQRWIERSNALGGSLREMLPTLTVELALLQDDGEIATRSETFIDLVTLPEHGVGYERKGSWHYLLPEATHKQGRRPSRAYRQLFKDDGLPADSFDHRDLRLYRLAVQRIGVSEPTVSTHPEPDDGLSDVHAPNEVLDHEP
jgi:hypothetical protein